MTMALSLVAGWLLTSSRPPEAAAMTTAAGVPAQVATTAPAGSTGATPTTATTATATTVPAASSAAPTTVAETKIGDPASDRRIRRIVIALLALAAVVLVITIIFWRATRPVPKTFGRLDMMGTRAWRKADETGRAELLGRPVPLTIVPDGQDDAVPDRDPSAVPRPPEPAPLEEPVRALEPSGASPGVAVDAPEPAPPSAFEAAEPAGADGQGAYIESATSVPPPPPPARDVGDVGAPPLEVVGEHQPGEPSV
jgi:hypothetical protein